MSSERSQSPFYQSTVDSDNVCEIHASHEDTGDKDGETPVLYSTKESAKVSWTPAYTIYRQDVAEMLGMYDVKLCWTKLLGNVARVMWLTFVFKDPILS